MQKGIDMIKKDGIYVNTVGELVDTSNYFLDMLKLLDENDHNIYDISSKLLENYSSYISTWWDDKTFNWACSDVLIEKCHNYFDIWWNPDKFEYDDITIRFLFGYMRDEYIRWFCIDVFKTIHIGKLDFCKNEFNLWFKTRCLEEDKLFIIDKFSSILEM